MIKDFLKKYHFRPLKRLGQNFLINKKVLGKIIEAADLSKNDTVLEIGPGLGILTLELAKKTKLVMAVEKDKKMVEILKEVIKEKNIKNIKVVEGDILKTAISNLLLCHSELGSESKKRSRNRTSRFAPCNCFAIKEFGMTNAVDYKVVANLPYYITSPVIRKFLEAENPPKEMILMVQKEVGQRICAQPPKMSLLSVAVQFYAQPKIIDYVSKKSFWPQPKVDSAIIKIANLHKFTINFTNKFFKIAKAGFSHPRKQLINNFSQSLNLDKEKLKRILLKSKIDPTLRAGALTVDNWRKLVGLFGKNIV